MIIVLQQQNYNFGAIYWSPFFSLSFFCLFLSVSNEKE